MGAQIELHKYLELAPPLQSLLISTNTTTLNLSTHA